MSKTKIKKLTQKQEALIPVYREKWRRIALSTKPIDRQKASKAVKAAYKFIRLREPEIIFCDSPYAGDRAIVCLHDSQLWRQLGSELWTEMWDELRNELESKLQNELENKLESQIERQLQRHLESQIEWDVNSYFYLEQMPCYGMLFDFCISVLGCAYDPKQWQILQSLLFDCGWIFPFEKTCYVCDRPRILSFDNQQRLHAEGQPAIQYANGFSVYAYHGVRLPKKYGQLHPNQWQVQWILEERNAELRRVLIQGIGYARICQELQATELDSWREYTLVKIDNNFGLEPIYCCFGQIDSREPIYLLKMTCPSTGFIHALRVPPDMKSAREAISWVNWGVDPEDFAVET